MTVLIGMLCIDGVVIGADSSATFSAGPFNTIEQPAMKIFVVNDVLIAGTGAVGLMQRFHHVVTTHRATGHFSRVPRQQTANALCAKTIQDFGSTGIQCGPNGFGLGAMIAFPSSTGPELCEFQCSDFQPEFKSSLGWFVSMGSGQLIADPFLGLLGRVFFDGSRPNVAEAIFGTLWALEHAIELNTGGIKGPSVIGVLSKDAAGLWRARILTDDDLTEHHSNIKGAETHLAAYRTQLSQPSTTTTNAPPIPPTGPTQR